MAKKRKKMFRRIVLGIFIIILILGGTAFGFGYFMLNKISNNDVAAKNVDIKKPINVLLLGVDAGDYKSKSKNVPKRSDTMMLVRYNPALKSISILSIPRDTRVVINNHTEKLNAAHAIGGPQTTIKTIEDMLGIDINYYAEIDYEGFRECIDAIGGVDVVIPRDMDYDAWKISVHFKKGEKVHLDGEKAEQFVRWRKNNDGSGYAMGDLGRISTQQDFMIKVMEKVKTPSGMLRIPNLISTLSKYLKTNMDSKTMLRYALKARSLQTSTIDKQILPGEPKYINGISYYIWNKDKGNDFIAKFQGHDEASNNYTAQRTDIDIIILNSTGENGLALQYKKKLEPLGYKVVEIGNYTSEKLNSTVINDYSERGYGNVLYKDLKLGEIQEKQTTNEKASLIVILGKDSIK